MRAIVLGLSLILVQGAQFRAPSDVGGEKGGKHPCVIVMRETQAACKGNSYGSSDDKCNFALCYAADLNRDRCGDVVTTGAPKNVNFPDDLDKLVKFHDVKCDGGEQKGSGIRNARFDCGKVDSDGLWDKEGLFLQRFTQEFPASAETSGLKACVD